MEEAGYRAGDGRTGCHWNLETSGQLRKSHCPALYLNEGLMNRSSMAPLGCSLTLTISVCRRARISRYTRSPKYYPKSKSVLCSLSRAIDHRLTKMPTQMVNLQL